MKRLSRKKRFAMQKVRIIVMRKTCHRDLMKNVRVSSNTSAVWKNGKFSQQTADNVPMDCVRAHEIHDPLLRHGGEGLYDGWMKNSCLVMISCNDDFLPVSLLLETMDENV